MALNADVMFVLGAEFLASKISNQGIPLVNLKGTLIFSFLLL